MHACMNELMDRPLSKAPVSSKEVLTLPFCTVLSDTYIWVSGSSPNVQNFNSIKICTSIEVYPGFQDDLLLCQLLCKLQYRAFLGSLAHLLLKGSINCHNSVSKFGDRCAYCLVSFSISSSLAELTCSGQSKGAGGSSSTVYQNGMSQPNEQCVENVNRETMRRDEKTRRAS